MKFSPSEFPKIPQYKQQADWLHCVNNVVCMEKIDGTNTRIGISKDAQSADDIVIGGRTLLEHEEKFSQNFICDMIRKDKTLCKAMLFFAKEIDANVTFYGETCGGSIQACGFIYGKINFVLFAAVMDGIWCSYSRTMGGDKEYPTLMQISKRLDFTLAPVLYQGTPNVQEFTSLLDRRSQHSENRGFRRQDTDNTHEGIVIWSDPLLFNNYGEALVAKYKHPNRQEYIAPTEEQQTPQDFAKRVVLRERIRHAMEYLKEQGRWQEEFFANKENVIRRVIQDISREVDEYQQQLNLHGKKNVRKALSSEAEKQFSMMKT
ncbi:RNA ligase family protein [Candidatus Uabimicrobium amorphum]|uniref:RNA ligase domain-containing protein n=1 Tax=Uabimicrobium amorphum TaxID=2596890 RepID=A0A5S9IJ97_UABAM|nr:RNA ligase family protein [Candidatus Uabimicrobium amorphum]BBM82734.1 hypothetical protein UABAM_01077 [Candidatus Uabimicrobium amorphum]